MTASSARPWPFAPDSGGSWLDDAAGELAHLGFVLRDGSRPGSKPGPRLLLAFRDRPTLEHFDPEEATFWELHADRGRLARLDRGSAVPIARPFSWGRIRIADRIPVANQFLGFGGMLVADARSGDGTLVAFCSPAPIVRWAGHSQGVDAFADEIGSFFARLMVPVDYQPEAEARIGAADPEALYAAFLHHASRRLHKGSALRDDDPAMAATVEHEAHRLAHDVPGAWQDGEALLDWLELG